MLLPTVCCLSMVGPIGLKHVRSSHPPALGAPARTLYPSAHPHNLTIRSSRVGVRRAQETIGLPPHFPSKLARTLLRGMRADWSPTARLDEALLRARVRRAQETNSPHVPPHHFWCAFGEHRRPTGQPKLFPRVQGLTRLPIPSLQARSFASLQVVPTSDAYDDGHLTDRTPFNEG
jgi:hypothetical protein